MVKLASTEWLVYKAGPFYAEYLALLFKAPYFRNFVMQNISGMGSLKRTNPKKLNDTWLPVPPLAEQKRIVTKVEELLKQVDALKV